jgi:hypothetical protein
MRPEELLDGVMEGVGMGWGVYLDVKAGGESAFAGAG